MSLERLQSKICICKQKSDYNFALNIWRLTKNYSKAWSHILVFQYKKNKKRKAAGFLKHRKNTLYLGKARTLTSKVQKCVHVAVTEWAPVGPLALSHSLARSPPFLSSLQHLSSQGTALTQTSQKELQDNRSEWNHRSCRPPKLSSMETRFLGCADL